MLSGSRHLNNIPARTFGVHSRPTEGSLRSARDHRDRQRSGETWRPAPACQHFSAPHNLRPFPLLLVCGYRSLYWELPYESLSHDSSVARPSVPTPLVSKQTPISLDSLKNRFLDQIRVQKTVSIADFRTDQEIEIEIAPESNFDSAKAKNAALTLAKGWQKISGQPKVSVSIWQGVSLLAKESIP